MSSLKDRRRRGTEHAFTASGLDKTGDIVAQINAPRPVEADPTPQIEQEAEPTAKAPDPIKAQARAAVPSVVESVADKVLRRSVPPRKSTPVDVKEEHAGSAKDISEEKSLTPSLENKPETEAVDPSEKDPANGTGESSIYASVAVANTDPPEQSANASHAAKEMEAAPQFLEAEESAAELPKDAAQPAVEQESSPEGVKPALTAWEKLAAINAKATRRAPSSRRYIAHVPAGVFDACRVLRGDWPITTWFVSLVAKYHDDVVKDLVGTTPDASLGVVPRRVYRKQEENTKCFLLYFANTELGLAQQAFFEECLSFAGTTTEYVVAILQSHVNATSVNS